MQVNVTSLKTGKSFPVTVSNSQAPHFGFSLKAFGALVHFENHPQAGECIHISEYGVKTSKKEIESFFCVSLKTNQSVKISLTKESAKSLIDAQSQILEDKKAWDLLKDQKAATMPVSYHMHDFLDWGDYSITAEKRIYVYRAPMPEFFEESPVCVRSYVLDNANVDAYGWKEDFKANGGSGNVSSVEISADLANKWFAVHAAFDAETKQKRAEEQMLVKQKIDQAEAERKAKFAEAKITGKPVLLTSIFLSGSQIPKRMRDEDSDMGHLCTYAMPDGSVSESFNHAY